MKQPGQITVDVTKAMRRALIATSDQQVFRTYGRDGNVLTCEKPGIHSRTLWRIWQLRMIEDDDSAAVHAGLSTKVRMRLTRAGFVALGKKWTAQLMDKQIG
jgi:hypothetical protein